MKLSDKMKHMPNLLDYDKAELLKMIELAMKMKKDPAKYAKELSGKWWQGRDKKFECPRLEFIGMVKHSSPFFSSWFSFIDLVFAFCNYPDNYKVEKVTRHAK